MKVLPNVEIDLRRDSGFTCVWLSTDDDCTVGDSG
jgi:hypothetical protein